MRRIQITIMKHERIRIEKLKYVGGCEGNYESGNNGNMRKEF